MFERLTKYIHKSTLITNNQIIKQIIKMARMNEVKIHKHMKTDREDHYFNLEANNVFIIHNEK